jgi:hypothetical protein
MFSKKILAFLVIVATICAPVLAAVEYTTTTIYFSVAAFDEVTVTLRTGNANVTSPTGTATFNNIEFNTSVGTNEWTNPRVYEQSTLLQESGSPIISIDNTGTTNCQLNISINETVPACMGLKYNTTWQASAPLRAGSTNLGAANITLNNSWGAIDGPTINLYLWGNFTDCPAGTSARTLYIWASFA